LSIYAQQQASSKRVSTNGDLESARLEICGGKLNGYHYVAIVDKASKHALLRGRTRNTASEAMESFIDTVLLTGRRFKKTIERQRDEHNEAVRLGKLKSK